MTTLYKIKEKRLVIDIFLRLHFKTAGYHVLDFGTNLTLVSVRQIDGRVKGGKIGWLAASSDKTHRILRESSSMTKN